MSPESADGSKAAAFKRMSAGERVKLLEGLREEQIRALVGILGQDPDRQSETPELQITGSLITQLSSAIDVFQEKADRARNRAIAIVVSGLFIFAGGTLLLKPVRSTAVFIQTKSAALSFLLERSTPLLRGSSLSTNLELSGAGGIFLGNRELPHRAGQGFQVIANKASGSPGEIGLGSVELPAGALIDIMPTGAHEIQIAVFSPKGAPPPSLQFNLEGEFTQPGGGAPIMLGEPTPLEAVLEGRQARMSLTFAKSEIGFNTPFRAKSLRWHSESPLAIEESSILSGKVMFDELGTRSASVRSGAAFRAEGAGIIRKLKVSGGLLECDFEGEVTQLSAGAGSARRDLMPSRLEWLRSRDVVFQFWTALAAFTGLALGFNRWWRKPE